MVTEQMIQEAPFNALAYLLLQFVIFTFVLNIASDLCMLVQKSGLYLAAKEIPLCPVKSRRQLGVLMKG